MKDSQNVEKGVTGSDFEITRKYFYHKGKMERLSNYSEVSSDRKHKPSDALSRIVSKSMNEINFMEENDQSLQSSENSQSVEDLISRERKNESDNFDSDNDSKMQSKTIGTTKYHSTNSLPRGRGSLCLRDIKNITPYPLNKKKSYSLSNLTSFKKPNYNQVQSKVKQYIQERKRHEFERKICETSKEEKANSKSKSLPQTPIKSKLQKQDKGNDDHISDDLAFSTRFLSDYSHKELLELKNEMQDEEARTKILDSILSQLKKERKSSVDLQNMLNVLQLDYNHLLAQYAHAKNTIDDLRLYKDNNEKNKPQIHSSSQKRSSKVMKAFSTSNIFSECSSFGNHPAFEWEPVRPIFTLVRTASSPLINSNTHPPVIDQKKKNDRQMSHNRNSISEDTFNKSLISSSESLPCEWMEKCQYVFQRLREFNILETNCYLNEEERNNIWDYILQKYVELETEYQCSSDGVEEHGCRKKLLEMEEAVEALTAKFGLRKLKKDNKVHNSIFHSRGGSSWAPGDTYSSYADSPCLRYSLPKLSPNNQEMNLSKSDQPREIDSGYPPSDRSTKNSLFPSDHSESLIIGSAEARKKAGNENNIPPNFPSERKVIIGQHTPISRPFEARLHERSGPTLAHRPNFHHHYSLGKPMAHQQVVPDEEYDASGSSEIDDSCGEDNDPRKLKKRHPKTLRSSNLFLLNKYEDRFVSVNKLHSNTSKTSLTHSTSTRNVVDLAQIEKHSKHLETQVNRLKFNGMKRGKDRQKSRVCHLTNQNTPLKALSSGFRNTDGEILSPLLPSSSDNNNTPTTSTPKSQETFLFQSNCRRCSMPTSETNEGTPMFHPKTLQKIKRAQSVPSLYKQESRRSAPFINIEYYSCDQKGLRDRTRSTERTTKSRMEYVAHPLREERKRSLEMLNVSKEEVPAVLKYINEATCMAENVRHRTHRILNASKVMLRRISINEDL